MNARIDLLLHAADPIIAKDVAVLRIARRTCIATHKDFTRSRIDLHPRHAARISRKIIFARRLSGDHHSVVVQRRIDLCLIRRPVGHGVDNDKVVAVRGYMCAVAVVVCSAVPPNPPDARRRCAIVAPTDDVDCPVGIGAELARIHTHLDLVALLQGQRV